MPTENKMELNGSSNPSPLVYDKPENDTGDTSFNVITNASIVNSTTSLPFYSPTDTIDGINTVSTTKVLSTDSDTTPTMSGTTSSDNNLLDLNAVESISDLQSSDRATDSPSVSDQPTIEESASSEISDSENESDENEMNEMNEMNETNIPDESSNISDPLDDSEETSVESSVQPTFKPLTFSLLTPTGNESKWVYGPPLFLKYMNTKYKTIQRKRVSQPKHRIVYEKKGTTGMAGQMIGVCDTLLLGILHNRGIQSGFLVCILRVVWAPALPEGMFVFPLSNLTYQAVRPRGLFACFFAVTNRSQSVWIRSRSKALLCSCHRLSLVESVSRNS